MSSMGTASTWLKRYERGSREIGIFELAELLGVSTEALRKYEAKDISGHSVTNAATESSIRGI